MIDRRNETAMKKYATMIIAMLGLLLMLSAQASDQYPTNPWRARDMELVHLDQQLRQEQATDIRPKGSQTGNKFHLDILTEPTLISEGVLKIIPEISGNFTYLIQVYIDDLPSTYGLDNGMLYSLHDIEETTVTLPQLVLPGNYRVTFFCYTKSSSDYVGFASYEFTLSPDTSHPSLDNVIDNVLNHCLVAGDAWQTALNLHDWLTHHAHYDGTYTNYGPDGVLIKGTGVCDSYSKAYFLLLKKAGIPVERVISNKSMNHAWNLVCFDGNWTHVDVTWDDPGALEGPIVSGSEYHHFFAVSDEFIQDSKYEHDIHFGYETMHNCTTMAYSAILRLHEEWPFVDTWYSDYTTGTYTDMIQEQLNQGRTTFDINLYDKVSAGGNSYYWASNCIGDFYLYALIQSFNSWTNSQGTSLVLNIVFDQDAMKFHVTASPDFLETGSLVLPDNLLTLEAEAFSEVKASTVIIQDGCLTIGPLAFSSSGVHNVYIPASVENIDTTAFDGCDWVTIHAPKGSTAADFAIEHGLHLVTE